MYVWTQYKNIHIHKANVNIPKGGIDVDTILVGSFKILCPETHKYSRKEINKGTADFNYISMYLITYRTPHPMDAEWTFFSNSPWTIIEGRSCDMQHQPQQIIENN